MFNTFYLKTNLIVISDAIDRSSSRKMLHRYFVTQRSTLYFLCIFLDLHLRFLGKILIRNKQLFIVLLILSHYEMPYIIEDCFFRACRAMNLVFGLEFAR